MRKNTGTSTTVGSIRVKSSAKSDTVFSGKRGRSQH